jgi:hypothetical protein
MMNIVPEQRLDLLVIRVEYFLVANQLSERFLLQQTKADTP